MLIELFEQSDFSSQKTDLDFMLDYTIDALKERGVQIKRYDKRIEPEVFEKVEGYALPVLMVDGEILSAGAYDFTLIDRTQLSGKTCTKSSCSGCLLKGNCSQRK